MQELYLIMRELLEIEYNQQSLLCMIEMLGRQEESEEIARLTVSGIGYYLTALHKDLNCIIGRLDSYIAENAKKK